MKTLYFELADELTSSMAKELQNEVAEAIHSGHLPFTIMTQMYSVKYIAENLDYILISWYVNLLPFGVSSV